MAQSLEEKNRKEKNVCGVGSEEPTLRTNRERWGTLKLIGSLV